MVMLALYSKLTHKGRRILLLVFLLVVLCELAVSTFIGVYTVRTTSRDTYLWRNDEVQRLLAKRDTSPESFYRTEFTRWYSVNDSTLYGYKGISIFSSTLGAHTSLFLEGMGLPSWPLGNRYYYAETSPLSNTFLNLRYLINRDVSFADGGTNWFKAADENGVTLWENRHYLPLGFMVRPELVNYKRGNNPITNQNAFFTLASGLSGNLFTTIEPDRDDHTNYTTTYSGSGNYRYEQESSGGGILKWVFSAPRDGLLYAYISGPNDVNVERLHGSRTWEIRRPFIICLGSFWAGEEVTLSMDITNARGNLTLTTCYFDQSLFETAIEFFSAQPLVLHQVKDTEFKGRVTSLTGGLLYTSIPYEEGWSATVNGVPTPIVTIDGCMAAVAVDAGTSSITFSYRNEGLFIGLSVSVASLLILVGLFWLERYFLSRSHEDE